MRYYAQIRSGTVVELLPEYDDTFPGVPIEERYSADFLAGCAVLEELGEVRVFDLYDRENGTFAHPPEPESPKEEAALWIGEMPESNGVSETVS